jgi:hypothetical protein
MTPLENKKMKNDLNLSQNLCHKETTEIEGSTSNESSGIEKDIPSEFNSFLQMNVAQIKEKKHPSLPLLNLEKVNNTNYDSEKETYENIEDKLRKIKKRFEMISKEFK